jgi:beta-carotene 3-hydroxylase
MFHDGLVHRRYPTPLNAKSRFWKRLIQAHRIHHAVTTKDGCVSYGFLLAQPVRKLKAQLAAIQQYSSPHEVGRGRPVAERTDG